MHVRATQKAEKEFRYHAHHRTQDGGLLIVDVRKGFFGYSNFGDSSPHERHGLISSFVSFVSEEREQLNRGRHQTHSSVR